MYYKGANLIHMTRTLIDDDQKWREILRGLNSEFGLKTTSTEEVVNYLSKKSGKDLTKVYDQYLRYTNIPVLEYKTEGKQTFYRWKADVEGFNMPVRIKNGKKYLWINPETEWKKIRLKSGFTPDLENFYIKLKEV
jgi:aminopeptidase N